MPGPAPDGTGIAGGQVLLVLLEDGLDHSRVAGLFSNIKLLPGVDFVVDASAISRETLDSILLPISAMVPRSRRKRQA